jgi:hypothetical protein
MQFSSKDHLRRCCLQIKTAILWGFLQSIDKNSGHFTCRYCVPPCRQSCLLWILLRTLCYCRRFGPQMTLKGLILQWNTFVVSRHAPFRYRTWNLIIFHVRFVLPGAEGSCNRPCKLCGERQPIVLDGTRAFCAWNSSCQTCTGT